MGCPISFENFYDDSSALDELYRLIEHSTVGNVLTNQEGIILMVNLEIEKKFGYGRKELIGQAIEILLAKDCADYVKYRLEYVKNFTTRQMDRVQEQRGLCKNGQEISIEIVLSVVRIKKKLYLLASINDISEHKIAEANSYSNSDFEQLAYITSHDLQIPLRQIISYSQCLAEKNRHSHDPESHRWIAYIIEGAKQMKALVDGLSAFSQITSDLPIEYTDLNDVLSEVQKQLAKTRSISKANIQAETLPSIFARPSYMKQLFFNLIDNALTFHRPNVTPQINIRAQQNQGFWEITFQDNGIGIHPQHHQRIFNMFQRLNVDKNKGIGIGLAICKKIIEMHGGQIWVESNDDKSTTFHFTLKIMTMG